MRRLLYVPIIHSEVDLGGIGAALAREGSALLTEDRQALHRTTMTQFWGSVRALLLSLDLLRLKVYQDGLTTDGDLGRHIVEVAAQRGSDNYRLILELIDGGARIAKTEDAALLMQERQNMVRLLEPTLGATGSTAEDYRRQRDRLGELRDKFIASAIAATLGHGETGVLFIGAWHDVAKHLSSDISVSMVKSPEKVRAYFEQLLLGHDAQRLRALATCLAAPVSAPSAF